MAKIGNGVRRIVVEDFKSEDRDVVGKLAFSINPFFGDLVNALNNGLTISDNMNASIVNVEFTAPATKVTVKTNLRGSCGGTIPIAVTDLSNNPGNLTGAPFVEFSNTDVGQITITNVTGVTSGKKYNIRLILLGE